MSFINRAEAGRQLALRLEHLCGGRVLVLGIPGGGVPVAAQVARAVQAPLDVVVINRLGVPFQPERTLGAVGEDGIRLIDEAAVRRAGVSHNELAALEARECAKVEARAARLRGVFPHRPLAGRVVVLIDDGAVTGASMLAACRAAYSRGAQRVVVGLPVAPPEAITRLESVADEVVCLHPTPGLVAVGEQYAEFDPVSDEDVRDYLAAIRPAQPLDGPGGTAGA